jgi:hypothetical protein
MQKSDNPIKIKIDIVKNIIFNKKNEMDTMFDNLLHNLNITDSHEIDILSDYCYNNHIDPSIYNIFDNIQKRMVSHNEK